MGAAAVVGIDTHRRESARKYLASRLETLSLSDLLTLAAGIAVDSQHNLNLHGGNVTPFATALADELAKRRSQGGAHAKA